MVPRQCRKKIQLEEKEYSPCSMEMLEMCMECKDVEIADVSEVYEVQYFVHARLYLCTTDKLMKESAGLQRVLDIIYLCIRRSTQMRTLAE